MYDDIFIFVKVAQAGGYSKASQILEVSQPTLSRRVKELEDRLGVNLVTRTSKNFELTDSGKEFYECFSKHEQNIQNKIHELTQDFQDISGQLRIALHPAIARELISPKIPQFMQKYPKLELTIVYTPNKVDMMVDNYNLAITNLAPRSASSKINQVNTFHLRLYAAPKYIERYGLPTNIEELRIHHIVGQTDFVTSQKLENYEVTNLATGDQFIFNYQASLYSGGMMQVASMATSGDYIIMIWDSLIKDELECGELIPILPEYSFRELPCYLICRQQMLTKPEQALVDFLEECLK
jgi:DNA-binding transcriptional LysR family regulator